MFKEYLKRYLVSLYSNAMELNDKNVCEFLSEFWPFETLLDVGCWDWEKTIAYSKNANSEGIYGIEVVKDKAKEAEKKWITTYSIIADREKWPFEDNALDCVVSNQVIEHLSDIDFFISEAKRVLKQWGYLITSTNNLSSWHNIFATIMGWTPFDLTNSSKKWIGIWNPLAIHQWETTINGDSWTHKTILNTRWLNSWFSLYGFSPIKVKWSWYYPLPNILGYWFPKHSAFITLANRKI